MKQRIEPDFDFDRGPAFWSATTLVILGLLANFVVFRPNWLPWVAMIAGGIAAARSGFYQQSANSAVVGILLGMVVLSPVLAVNRVMFWYGIDGTGDTVFLTIALSLGWLIIALVVFVPLGYVGAIIVDFTRRRIGGPIGY